jgi:hypothetical protein
VDHEEIVAAVLERLAVVVAVDVVLNLASTGGIDRVGTCRRYCVDVVADCLKTLYGVSVNDCGEEREDDRSDRD